MISPTSAISIRPASEADVPAMFAIRLAVRENAMTAAELAHAGITPESIANAVRSAPCAWVAETAGETVGFAMVDLDDACLFAAFVLPAHEGRGAGSALIRSCEALLFGRHPLAGLETAGASRAARLYRHLGWTDAVALEGGDIRMEKLRPDGPAT